jgi:hypothetical protein
MAMVIPAAEVGDRNDNIIDKPLSQASRRDAHPSAGSL